MMENFKLIIELICLISCLVNGTFHRKRRNIVQKFHRTGEAIVTDDLIAKYEHEHQTLYEEERKYDYLEWPNLDKKDLSDYCTKYLQNSIPNRITNTTTGTIVLRTLNYEKANTNINNTVVVVKCKLVKRPHCVIFYYVTRTPEPNCAYALKCIRIEKELLFFIINKYCDFEDKPLINMFQKKKRELVDSIHRRSGQPIAKDIYILEYELEHQEMVKEVGKEGGIYAWSHEMIHDSLDSYCYKYMGQCAPGRNREGIIGSWKFEKLHYQKLNINENINIITVACRPSNTSARYYHMTRAPETNCVYALLRQQSTTTDLFVIIFKHCDFENPITNETIQQDDGTIDKEIIPKSEVKEEIMFDALVTQQFFLTD